MTSELIIGNAGKAGRISLNRPKAIHALTTAMCTGILETLEAWRGDAEVEIVLLPFRGGKEAAQPADVRRIKIGAGKIRYIRLNPPAGIDWYTAVVTPVEGSGPVLVAHRVREKSRYGDLVTGYPWNPLRVQVSVPTAVQDPAVAIR